jgi:hypothetical protein
LEAENQRFHVFLGGFFPTGEFFPSLGRPQKKNFFLFDAFLTLHKKASKGVKKIRKVMEINKEPMDCND